MIELFGKVASISVQDDGSYVLVLKKEKIENEAPFQTLNLEKLEKIAIAIALHRYSTIDEAARELGINVSTLWRKRKQYGLSKALNG